MQTTNEIWGNLGTIPIGTIVAWLIVICTILGAIITAGKKIYKVFDKAYQLREENHKLVESHTQKLESLENTLCDFKETLQEISNANAEQKEVNLMQLRHEIIITAEAALAAGSITTSALASLEEMFEKYQRIFNGNGYVKTLVEKVRKLPVDTRFD